MLRSTSVATMASIMARAAIWLPRRAVLGCESCLMPRMNAKEATKYEMPTMVSRISRLSFRLLLEHLEHAVGDDKAAKNVGGSEHDSHKADRVHKRRFGRASDQHSAQQHDAVNRVRTGHERRMQNVRHACDDFEAHEDREQEDVRG